MGFLSWLKGKTPTEADTVEIRVFEPPDFFVSVNPNEDEQNEFAEAGQEDTVEDAKAHVRFDLEPMFLVIDYRDAAGNFSRRRITTRWLEKRGSNNYVGAICHERQAHRTFRLDRIEGLIDDDGVVEEATPFFEDVVAGDLGYEIDRKAKKVSERMSSTTASPYTLLRRELKPAIVVLSAAARVDSLLHPEEVDRIMVFTETEAEFLKKEGVINELPGLEGFNKFGRLVKRLRPTQHELDEALKVISAWPTERLQRLMNGVVSVVQADGIVLDCEFSFVTEIADWMRERRD